MFGNYVRLKIKRDIWHKIVNLYGENDENIIMGHVIDTYLRNKTLSMKTKEQKRIIDKNAQTIEELRRSLDQMHEQYEEMKDICNKIQSELKGMRKRYRELKQRYDVLVQNPIVKEKIVYKENTATIEALRKKREKLQKELWNMRKERDDLLKEKARMVAKIKEYEGIISKWKSKNFALLIVAPQSMPSDFIEKTRIYIIDAEDYYLYRTNVDAFVRKKNIHGPYVVKLIEY